jgi:bifunctional non-homologous end joining protein LigD
MWAAFAHLPTRAAVLDGELCLIDATGQSNFRELHDQMRTRWPGEDDLVFMAFDLLHQDGVDLRHLPLAERKWDLERLCRRAKVPFMRQVQTFPNGQLLFEHCSKFGFEGVVSKRLDRPYVSGPCKCWVKVKCPGWKRENSERFRMFEGRGR